MIGDMVKEAVAGRAVEEAEGYPFLIVQAVSFPLNRRTDQGGREDGVGDGAVGTGGSQHNVIEGKV